MARYSADHRDQTRARIVALAADRIRVDGLAALSVAGVMEAAGLTHGGFYAHFGSRDALLAEAVTHLFTTAADAVGRFQDKYGDKALAKYVDFYLSPRHRDDPALGCPIPSLAGEVRHASPDVRAAFDRGLDHLADRLGALHADGGRVGRKAALALLGEMAGVVMIARSLSDERRSTALLADARRAALP